MNRMSYRGGSGGELAGGPLQRARLALMNNQPAVAEDICRRRLEKKPDDNATRLLLAQALIQMQRGREGIIEARRVLEAQPNSVDALMLLSAALASGNQLSPPKEALTAAERAVQLQPKNARARVQLAEIYMTQRKTGLALAEADEALRLDPRLAAAHMIKGMAMLNGKDYEGAVQSFQGALRQDRTMAPAQFGMAQALAELRRPDEALEAVGTAQKLNPLLPPAQVMQLRALIFRKQRKYGAAYNEYLEFARKNSRNKRFVPVTASFSFFLSFFGQAAPVVIIFMLVAIFFGISRIPFAGGVLVDILVVALLGFGIWQVTKQYSGVSPLQRLMNPLALGTVVVALVVGFALVLGIGASLGRGLHHNYWFNNFSFGLAAIVALIAAALALNFGPGAQRS
jgi:tetratricopeptide (TPR) repeat protein